MRLFGFACAALFFAVQSPAAQEKRLERFFLSNSTLAESRAPIYIAQDLKLFEKFGLDAQIVNIRGSAINNAALMAGEIQMAVANGTIAITAAARGAPIVIIATAGPTRYTLVSRVLASPQQLKNRVIGIGGYGIGDYFVIRRLLPRLGFSPEKDVTLLPTGTTSSFERINMMLSGKADAVLASKSNIDRVEMRGVKLNLLADTEEFGLDAGAPVRADPGLVRLRLLDALRGAAPGALPVGSGHVEAVAFPEPGLDAAQESPGGQPPVDDRAERQHRLVAVVGQILGLLVRGLARRPGRERADRVAASDQPGPVKEESGGWNRQ